MTEHLCNTCRHIHPASDINCQVTRSEKGQVKECKGYSPTLSVKYPELTKIDELHDKRVLLNELIDFISDNDYDITYHTVDMFLGIDEAQAEKERKELLAELR